MAYSIQISVDPWEKKITEVKIRETRGWQEQNADLEGGFGR